MTNREYESASNSQSGDRYRWSRLLPDLGRERGANLIEMAFVTVLLLVLLAGIVDLGGAFQNFIIITNAAREGARTAARLPCRTTVAQRTALRAAIVDSTIGEAANSNVTLTTDNIVIVPDPLTNGCVAPGAPIRVTVTIQYAALLGNLWGNPEFPVRSSATMAYNGEF